MSRLTLITGSQACGKTSYVHKLLSEAAQHDYVGVICPAVFKNNNKIGIDALLLTGSLDTAERIRLATLSAQVEYPIPEDTGYLWDFDQTSLDKVNEHLRSLAANQTSTKTQPSQTLVIDELGSMEFIHNQGFTAAFGLLDKPAYEHSIVVVRLSCIEYASARWQDTYDPFEILNLSESEL